MATVVIRDVLHTYDWTKQDGSPSTESSGERPTLVFIHGWLLSRAYWEPVIKQLSQFYDCLSYDLRGFGESEAMMKGRASAFMSLIRGHDGECPCCRRPFAKER